MSSIYIDLQAAQTPSHAGRGIARYSVELALAMLRAQLPVSAIAQTRYHPQVELPEALASSPLLVTRDAHNIAETAAAGRFAYHLMSPMELERPPSRTLSSTALQRADEVVAVLYDLIPLLFPERYLVSPRSRATYDARLGFVRDVDMLLAISEHTRRDAIQHLGIEPERVVTIGGGAADFFAPASSEEEPARVLRHHHPEIKSPFLMTVAAWEWRKNLETLVHAVGRLDPSLRHRRQLVVVCSGLPAGERSWHRVAEEAGLDDDQFVVVGPVPDDVLRALYQSAELFVFPSRYEGFGLPVLEAARCGAPVLTSSTSSLPEILEHPDSTFSPDDDRALSELMERALTDEVFRDALISASAHAADRHTWDAVGKRVADAYATLWSDRSGNAMNGSNHPRMAFIGDADDPRITQYLTGRDCVVEVFEPGLPRSQGRSRPEVPVYPASALARLFDPFDYETIIVSPGAVDTELARSFDGHRGVEWLR